jgi:hypothetical protein
MFEPKLFEKFLLAKLACKSLFIINLVFNSEYKGKRERGFEQIVVAFLDRSLHAIHRLPTIAPRRVSPASA